MVKIKLVLIRPHENEDLNRRLPKSITEAMGVVPPMGLAYIAAVSEKRGHKVRIIDMIIEGMDLKALQAELKKENPDLVGIQAMTSTFRSVLETAKAVKESNFKVVLGGPQIAAFPVESVSNDYVDFAIIGEADYSLMELLENLDKQSKYRDISGLVYKDKKNNVICSKEVSIVKNLDELPMPAHHLLKLEKYGTIISSGKTASMLVGRGCPYQCGFCFKQPTDKVFRIRSVDNVIKEIEYLVKKQKVKEIMFYDDTFTLRKDFVIKLCEEIIRKGIKVKWEAPTRINHAELEMFKLMKKAGCIRLRFGVESGNSRILKLMNKRITLEMVEDVFKWTKIAGIESFAYFIIGYITENEKTMRDTINFAKKIDPDYVMFNTATPFPKTNLFDLAEESGFINKDYWEQYTLGKKVNRLPYFVNNADKWTKRAYQEFYFRPKFILRKLFKIRSLDDIKKTIKGAKGILSFSA